MRGSKLPVAKSSKRIRQVAYDKPKRAKKGPTVSKLKKKLDAIFSQYIRARDKHTCYTCGLVMEPKKSQNGHFIPRQYLALRWSEINCHAQCYADNMLYNGQPGAYAIRLEKDYGEGIVAWLESQRKVICKLKPDWYEEQIKIYQDKLIALGNV